MRFKPKKTTIDDKDDRDGDEEEDDDDDEAHFLKWLHRKASSCRLFLSTPE